MVQVMVMSSVCWFTQWIVIHAAEGRKPACQNYFVVGDRRTSPLSLKPCWPSAYSSTYPFTVAIFLGTVAFIESHSRASSEPLLEIELCEILSSDMKHNLPAVEDCALYIISGYHVSRGSNAE